MVDEKECDVLVCFSSFAISSPKRRGLCLRDATFIVYSMPSTATHGRRKGTTGSSTSQKTPSQLAKEAYLASKPQQSSRAAIPITASVVPNADFHRIHHLAASTIPANHADLQQKAQTVPFDRSRTWTSILTRTCSDWRCTSSPWLA